MGIYISRAAAYIFAFGEGPGYFSHPDQTPAVWSGPKNAACHASGPSPKANFQYSLAFTKQQVLGKGVKSSNSSAQCFALTAKYVRMWSFKGS